MTETWRVVFEGGDVREVSVRRGDDFGCEATCPEWAASAVEWVGAADDVTPRRAVAALAATWRRRDLVEILAPGDLSRAQLVAEIATLKARRAACLDELADMAARCERGSWDADGRPVEEGDAGPSEPREGAR